MIEGKKKAKKENVGEFIFLADDVFLFFRVAKRFGTLKKHSSFFFLEAERNKLEKEEKISQLYIVVCDIHCLYCVTLA